MNSDYKAVDYKAVDYKAIDYKTIEYQVDNKILTLLLNRPEVMNAYTIEMCNELVHAFNRASDDADVSVVVVTGAGRAFCAGMDLSAEGNVFGLDETRTPTLDEMQSFEEALTVSKSENSLDSVINWFNAREHALLQRMSYLHPVSALPIVNYVAMKVQEVTDLRLIVRGRLAGLPPEVLEAHIL